MKRLVSGVLAALMLAGCASAGLKLDPATVLAPRKQPIPAHLSAPCVVPRLSVGDDAKVALKLNRDQLKICRDKKAALVKLYRSQ